jgi:hypothetical protein
MMSRALWHELKPKWPEAFWDDWLRSDAQRKGRACIRPEVSRNFNFGEKGASNGQFYKEHIALNKPNREFVNYSTLDVLQYSRGRYDPVFLTQVYRLSLPATTAQLMFLQQDRNLVSNPLYFRNPNALYSTAGLQEGADTTAHPALHPNTPLYCGQHCLRRYTVTYSVDGTHQGFLVEATRWGLMTDIREGTPRGAYLGIVCFKAELRYPRPRTLFVENPEAQQDSSSSSSSRSLQSLAQQREDSSNMLVSQQQRQGHTGSSSSRSSRSSSSSTATFSNLRPQFRLTGGPLGNPKDSGYYHPVVVDDVLESHFEVCLAPPLSPVHQQLLDAARS